MYVMQNPDTVGVLSPGKRTHFSIPIEFVARTEGLKGYILWWQAHGPSSHHSFTLCPFPLKDCPRRSCCERIHPICELRMLKCITVHHNSWVTSLDAAPYRCLKEGVRICLSKKVKPVTVTPGGTGVPGDMTPFDSKFLYATAGAVTACASPEGSAATLQHCMHYLKGYCVRGAECGFGHLVFVQGLRYPPGIAPPSYATQAALEQLQKQEEEKATDEVASLRNEQRHNGTAAAIGIAPSFSAPARFTPKPIEGHFPRAETGGPAPLSALMSFSAPAPFSDQQRVSVSFAALLPPRTAEACMLGSALTDEVFTPGPKERVQVGPYLACAGPASSRDPSLTTSGAATTRPQSPLADATLFLTTESTIRKVARRPPPAQAIVNVTGVVHLRNNAAPPKVEGGDEDARVKSETDLRAILAGATADATAAPFWTSAESQGTTTKQTKGEDATQLAWLTEMTAAAAAPRPTHDEHRRPASSADPVFAAIPRRGTIGEPKGNPASDLIDSASSPFGPLWGEHDVFWGGPPKSAA